MFIDAIKSELLTLTFQSQRGMFHLFLMGNEECLIFLARYRDKNKKKHFHSIEIGNCYSGNSNYLFLRGKQEKKLSKQFFD